MREVVLPGGERVAALGQGTWRMGRTTRAPGGRDHGAAHGVELGMTLIDTAEMYGDGATESLLGEALAGLRNDVFLVSKAYPQNAGRGRLERTCEASLKRLRTDHLDLYLLHWRGSVPLAETVEGMEALQAAGKIRAWASATSTSTTWTSWRGRAARAARPTRCFTTSAGVGPSSTSCPPWPIAACR